MKAFLLLLLLASSSASAGERYSPSKIGSLDRLIALGDSAPPSTISHTRMAHPELLPVSIVCGLLAWDFLRSANRIDDQIKLLEFYQSEYNQSLPPGVNLEELKSDQKMKIGLGVGFIAAGILNTWIAIRPVEISSDGASLSLSYRF